MIQLTEHGKTGVFLICFLIVYIIVSDMEITYCLETGVCP
tara:strand:+ start:265 stop:384 length:120 start_codon:yes stop_codon:yes gene_type:complete